MDGHEGDLITSRIMPLSSEQNYKNLDKKRENERFKHRLIFFLIKEC